MTLSFFLMLVLAAGLAADAFAVSVTNGICYCASGGTLRTAVRCGAAFGLFQAVMPVIGYLAGYSFLQMVSAVDHWIALILLWVIGGRMLHAGWRELRDPSDCASAADFPTRALLLQAFATSVDALAVGIGLGVIEINLPLAVGTIGAVTFAACFCGVLIGRVFGGSLRGRAQLLGGIVLILIGLHIFAEHIHLFTYLFGFGPIRW